MTKHRSLNDTCDQLHVLRYPVRRMQTNAQRAISASLSTLSRAPCRVAFAEAAWQVSAELLCPYPPGIPAVVPGEVLTNAALDALTAVLGAGGTVTGASDSTLSSLLVLDLD